MIDPRRHPKTPAECVAWARELRRLRKENQGFRKDLTEFTRQVLIIIEHVEVTMRDGKLRDGQRGGRMAVIMNALDQANDAAMHFTLGWSFRVIRGRKTKLKQHVANLFKLRASEDRAAGVTR